MPGRVEPPVLAAPHRVPLEQPPGQQLARLGSPCSNERLDDGGHRVLRDRRVAQNGQQEKEPGMGVGDANSGRWRLHQCGELGPAQPRANAVLIVTGQDEILAPVGMCEEVVRGCELLAAVEVHDDREAVGQRHREHGPRRRVVERVQHGVRVARVRSEGFRREPLSQVRQVRGPEARLIQERVPVHDGRRGVPVPCHHHAGILSKPSRDCSKTPTLTANRLDGRAT